MDELTLRARLSGPDPADPLLERVLANDSEVEDSASLKPAAVLVGITTGPEPGVLLTKRAATLRSHSGQVSFPGGRVDAADASPEWTALREAQEEVGLDPACAEVLGRLNDYATVSGYRVTPVLALLPGGLVWTPSPHEVEAVFELKLSVLLDEAAPRRHDAMFQGVMRHYWVWPHDDHHIWGATAGILMHLARRLRGIV